MKVQFDDLTVAETNVLTQVLLAYRAGQPFSWSPEPSTPEGVVNRMGLKSENGLRSDNGHAAHELP